MQNIDAAAAWGELAPEDVCRLLRRMGASGKLRGFLYAAYMINQVRRDPERLQWITKRLYRETARIFQVSPCSVERNVRTLIRSCWGRGDPAFLERVAGVPLPDPPTNSEFIDMAAAFLSGR